MLTLAEHIHHATGPHGTAVLDVRRGTWMMLDADASKIWHALTVRGSTTGLAAEIAVLTGQDSHQVSCLIDAFIGKFVAAGVLVDTGLPTRRRRWWWR